MHPRVRLSTVPCAAPAEQRTRHLGLRRFDPDSADKLPFVLRTVDLPASDPQWAINEIDFGKRIRAEISVLNDEKGWTVAQTLAYMKDPKILGLDALLNAGAIETARDTMLVTDLSAHYTAQEITDIAQKLTDYLANE